jgi:16S rRNA (guanine966-N2)-methyltransferase
MRIIGGSAAGRLLKVPKGYDVRPTPDLVKQALFNSLAERVIEAEVLELFAGSGALGLECLSRGAKHVTSVEKASRHANFIRANFESLGLDRSKFELRVQEASAAISQLATAARKFDLVFADPPFGEKNVGRRSTSFSQRLLDNERLRQLLRPGGWLILGHTKRDQLTVPGAWAEHKTLRHGDSVFGFFELASGRSAALSQGPTAGPDR